jgi:hypothetical protein
VNNYTLRTSSNKCRYLSGQPTTYTQHSNTFQRTEVEFGHGSLYRFGPQMINDLVYKARSENNGECMYVWFIVRSTITAGNDANVVSNKIG